jgi:hypothetical protein
MSGKEMRKAALRRYVVFRIKAIEFLDLNTLRQTLRGHQINPAPGLRSPTFMSNSLRTVVLSWFALFVDKNGLNVIQLWTTLFPKYAQKVNEAWTRMEPAWSAIREFRDRAGFHADTPKKFFLARHRIQVEAEQLDAAVEEFTTLLRFFLVAEAVELPELEPELDALLDDLQKTHGFPYQKEQFKNYMMLHKT